MESQTRILIRMRDVGFALTAAAEFDQLLSRIRLQKLVYLLDVLVYLVELLPPSERHLTYKHGPFDAAIQNAVDCLAFRGLVRVSELHREPNGQTHSNYGLTKAGARWVERLTGDQEFRIRARVAESIAREINSIGWDQLIPLVYAEPTFVTARTLGYGTRLNPHDPLRNSAALVLKTMTHGLRVGFENTVASPELLFRLFFRYLKEFSHLRDQTSSMIRSGVGGAV
jgi:hypothetical protein